MKTFISFNQNEIRAVELIVRDQNDDAFVPTDAYASVLDSDDVVIVEEAAAMLDSNAVSTLIDTTVTANIGTYYIKWKLIRTVDTTNYTHYHRTRLDVMAM